MNIYALGAALAANRDSLDERDASCYLYEDLTFLDKGGRMSIETATRKNGKTGGGVLVPRAAGDRKSDLRLTARRRRRVLLAAFPLLLAMAYFSGVIICGERAAFKREFADVAEGRPMAVDAEFHKRLGLSANYIEFLCRVNSRQPPVSPESYLKIRNEHITEMID